MSPSQEIVVAVSLSFFFFFFVSSSTTIRTLISQAVEAQKTRLLRGGRVGLIGRPRIPERCRSTVDPHSQKFVAPWAGARVLHSPCTQICRAASGQYEIPDPGCTLLPFFSSPRVPLWSAPPCLRTFFFHRHARHGAPRARRMSLRNYFRMIPIGQPD